MATSSGLILTTLTTEIMAVSSVNQLSRQLPRQHPSSCVKTVQWKGFSKAHGGAKMCGFKGGGCEKNGSCLGLCCAHGGGSKYKHISGCDKYVVRKGLCAAHGGAKK